MGVVSLLPFLFLLRVKLLPARAEIAELQNAAKVKAGWAGHEYEKSRRYNTRLAGFPLDGFLETQQADVAQVCLPMLVLQFGNSAQAGKPVKHHPVQMTRLKFAFRTGNAQYCG